MDISLTPHEERLIQKKLETGLYVDASEVIREALRLMLLPPSTANADDREKVERPSRNF